MRLTIETELRAAVAKLVAKGKYPDNTSIRDELGRPSSNPRSGLGAEQSRWRIDEVEKAGFNWDESKKAKKLVR